MSKWTIGTKLVHDRDGGSEYSAEGAHYGQAYWESKGWRAVEPPAPVRELAEGWQKRANEMFECTGDLCMDLDTATVYARVITADGACEACAESMGVFAATPKVEPACLPSCLGRGIHDVECPMLPPWPDATPTPHCQVIGCKSTEKLAMRFIRKNPAQLVCEGCYLKSEIGSWAAQISADDSPRTGVDSPAAYPGGVVPQVLSDARIGRFNGRVPR